jgi:hypothetical protein
MRCAGITPVIRRKKKPAEILAKVIANAYETKQSHQHFWTCQYNASSVDKVRETDPHSIDRICQRNVGHMLPIPIMDSSEYRCSVPHVCDLMDRDLSV